MDPSDSSRLATLFEQALNVPVWGREAFLGEACPDAKLRHELLSLLEAHEGAGEYFDGLSERVVAGVFSSLTHPADSPDALADFQLLLGSEYRLEGELAGGGMSRVFVADDPGLKRRIVIKVMGPEMVPTASAERFRREIELSAQLQHPHIVPLLSAGSSQGALYYTMPFVAGESLRDRLHRDGPLPVDDALRIWADVLEALTHAHGRGVIHRDIKPGNILLSERHAVVTDFGVARALESVAGDARSTNPGLAIGTPAYMAPEQAAGEAVDQRVDLYQAGLVMYEMMTGRLPFDERSTRGLLMDRVTGQPAPLRRADAPARVIDLVMRCLARDPADRPPSADILLAEIELASQNDLVSGSVEAPMGWAAVANRPSRAALYLGAAVALGGVAAASLGLLQSPTGATSAFRATAIAVLPLTNLSADPTDAALADGMTQELAEVLGESTTLRVVASPPAPALEAMGMDLARIADGLQVGSLLQGTVEKDGPILRLQMRLVDPYTGSIRWSEDYSREFAAIFDLQRQIAEGVALELSATIRPLEDAGTSEAPRYPDVAAYEWYLRGMDVSLLRSRAGLLRGVEYFERAIAIDSTFAGAYAGLARTYVSIWNGAPTAGRRGWLLLAQEAATEAISSDASDAEAVSALGWVRLMSRRYAESEAAFKRALALNPDVPRGHEGLARLYMMEGRHGEQLAEAQLGLQSDPFSHSAIREEALALATNGRCEDALDRLRILKALTPPAGVAGVISGQCYASRQMWPEAIVEFQWAGDYSASFSLAFLAHSLARAGRTEEAASILSDLLEGRSESHGAFGIATVYAGLQDYDEAFAWLDRAIEENAVNAYLMHPMFADLHRDPRFDQVRDGLGRPAL